MGDRAQAQQAVRDRLTCVAFDLFRHRGYDATTVDEIAATAGVSPRTFYRYFPFKDAVLVESGLRILEDALSEIDGDDPIPHIMRTYAGVMSSPKWQTEVEAFVQLIREHPRLADRLPRWRQRLTDRLADHLTATLGRRAPDLACRLKSTLTIQCMAAVLHEWLADGGREPLASYVDTVLAEADRLLQVPARR